LKHLEATEIVMGLILAGKLDAEQVSPSMMHFPYDKALNLYRDGAEIAELYDQIGLPSIKAADEAGKIVSSQSPMDFLKLLERSYSREQLAMELEKQAKSLHSGQDADLLRIEGAIAKSTKMEGRYQWLKDITPDKKMFIPSYYAPLDEHIGGIPDSNLTIIAGAPGIGKTTLLIKLMAESAKRGRLGLFYTFEMTSGQLAHRFWNIYENKDKEIAEGIKITHDIMTIDEVYADASRLCAIEKIGIIGIDFADLMLTKDVDEPSVGLIYRTLATLAKKADVPVILLSQLNRSRLARSNHIPTIHDIRWSGLAESMAALILLLYSEKDCASLPYTDGRSWIIMGKSRFGHNFGKDGKEFAMEVEWDGKTGWGNCTFVKDMIT